MQSDTLAPLAALGYGMVRRMVACEDRLLNGGNDRVHDSQSGELARAAGHHVGRSNERSRTGTGGDVGSAVALPVREEVTGGLDVSLLHVGGNPGDNDVGALDKTPEIAVDTFTPVVGHGLAAQELEPLLQVETIRDHVEVPVAVREPDQGGELGTPNGLDPGDALDRQDASVLFGRPGNGPARAAKPRVVRMVATAIAVNGPADGLRGGQSDRQLGQRLSRGQVQGHGKDTTAEGG
jgi:hypothetical protein